MRFIASMELSRATSASRGDRRELNPLPPASQAGVPTTYTTDTIWRAAGTKAWRPDVSQVLVEVRHPL